jgi:hypothetical protein
MRKVLNDSEAFAEPWKVKISKRTVLEAKAWVEPLSADQKSELLSRLETLLDVFAASIGYRRQQTSFGNVLSRVVWLPTGKDPNPTGPLLCDALALSTREMAQFDPYFDLLNRMHTKPIRSEAILVSLLVLRDFGQQDGLSIRFAKRFLHDIRIGEVRDYATQVERNRKAALNRGIDTKELKEEALAQHEKLAKLGTPAEDRVRLIREHIGNRVSRQTITKWVRSLRGR